MSAAQTIGVVGAGTMGAGIAQLGCQAGISTRLHDPDGAALKRGAAAVRAGLEKASRKEGFDLDAAAAGLQVSPALEDLSGCDLVIEAAPEQADLKREPVRLVGAPDELLDRARELGLRVDAPDGPSLVSCRSGSLATQCGDVDACGFMIGPPLTSARIAEATRVPGTSDASCRATEGLMTALGLATEWVGDAPGLVLRRTVCQLVNEASFAIGEGVATAGDVDIGLTLGLNHPRGPVEWSEVIGPALVLETVDALWAERHEERYRAAPLLRRAAALGLASIAEAA